MAVTVRAIDATEHRRLAGIRPPRSFLQTPGWAAAKPGWAPRSLAWFDDGELVGTGLALLRRIPRTHRSLAYLPEGPDLDWEGLTAAGTVGDFLVPMVELLRRAGAFTVRIGPQVTARSWPAAAVKKALADRAADPSAPGRLGAVPTAEESPEALALAAELSGSGWLAPADREGFGTGQPRYTFRVPLAGRSEPELLAGFNQLWRRSIRAAAKAGVAVSRGDRADLAAFHALYAETAERDGFTPAPRATSGGCGTACTATTPTASGSTSDASVPSSPPRPSTCASEITPGTPTVRRRRGCGRPAPPRPSSGR